MEFPTAHAMLRDRRDWFGQRRGLALDRDGNLTLARLPAAGKAVEIAASYPYVREVSGITVGGCEALFISDTAHDRVLYVDGLCGSQAWLGGNGPSDLPGSFKAPRGLALTRDALRRLPRPLPSDADLDRLLHLFRSRVRHTDEDSS